MPTPAATPEGPQSWQDWSSAPPRPAPRKSCPQPGFTLLPLRLDRIPQRLHPPNHVLEAVAAAAAVSSSIRLLTQQLEKAPVPRLKRRSHEPRKQRIARGHPRFSDQPQQPPNPPPITRIRLPPIQPIVNRRPRNPQNPRQLRLVDRQRRLKLANLPRDGQRADGPAVHPKPADLTPIDPRTGRNPRKNQKRKTRVPPPPASRGRTRPRRPRTNQGCRARRYRHPTMKAAASQSGDHGSWPNLSSFPLLNRVFGDHMIVERLD